MGKIYILFGGKNIVKIIQVVFLLFITSTVLVVNYDNKILDSIHIVIFIIQIIVSIYIVYRLIFHRNINL